jgi:hypothetical protein
MATGKGSGTVATDGGVIVTTAEVKSYLRLDGSGSAIDTQIETMIDAAEAWVAERIGTVFTTATYTEYHDGGRDRIRPRVQPIVSVTSITDTHVLPADEAVESSDDYTVIDDGIYFTEDGGAPSDWTEGKERWKVIYVGGYNNGDGSAPSGSVAAPAGIKLAILALIHRGWYVQGGALQHGSQQTYKNFDGLDDGEVTRWLAPFDLRPMVY